MPEIEFRNVVKSFDGTVAVKDLSFSASGGEGVCLFGPSGCGKTTALRLAAGLETPDSGLILVGGVDTAKRKKKEWPKPGAVGMVFQDLALWPHMRAEKHLQFALAGISVPRGKRAARVNEMLRLCRLEEKRRAYPGEMSGGQQQRLAIARALVTGPELLLLDEPFANLDDDLKEVFMEEFLRRKEQGATIIFASHVEDEVERLSDRVLRMECL